MRLNKINSENVRLDENSQVSSTYTRTITPDEFSSGVLKNSRLTPFVGQMPERKTSQNVDYLVPVEEHARQLSEYAKRSRKQLIQTRIRKDD